MTDAERLEQLIQARPTAVSIVTNEEDYALKLVREVSLKRGSELWLWSIIGGVRDGMMADSPPIPDTEHPAAGLWYLLSKSQPIAAVTLDLAGHLKDEKILRLLRDLIRRFRETGGHLVMIDHREEMPAVVRAEATRFEISLPDEAELESIVRDTVRRISRSSRIEVEITRRGLKTVVRNLRGLTRRQAEQIIIDVVSEDRRFDENDINHVLARKRQALHEGGLLEYIEAPVDLEEIGGLRRLKSWLQMRQNAMSDEAGSFGLGMPRGVLMLGVQGAGKSLCAKAIATAWQRPLLRMDPCALYDRYVGESERRLREALHQAESMAPIILWIDEIEKAFASAASRSTDGGLSQRMFGTLLTWMQEHQAPVFLVATANDIEALPPELLRKGRFDEIFFVDLPGKETREHIFAIHLQKRRRDPASFDLDCLAKASDGYSGAEIEQAVISALHEAFASRRELNTKLILDALRASPPLSVTMAERIAGLRTWAEGRCVPAD
ncbi:MAG TPA: AAA family ATPase [Phycisphaerae bacterium]|nr:AAA family ATPase [Phycisphaerae bacterium]HPP19676.1 AAA family ATPase [Phycisphaerae bacterium]